MKLKNQVLTLFAAGLLLGGCSEENPWMGQQGEGGIKLRLSASGDVVSARPQTRAAGTAADVPQPSDFSIRLEKTDGSMSNTWATLNDFNNEEGFATGQYTLTAFYGKPEEEGFELPYYEGTTQLSVLEARETEAAVTATLANCMVSIDYTDAFKKYFSSYSTTIHSEGHSYVEVPQGETRPAYICPGNVDLTVEFTKPNGKSAKIQPAQFIAEARHHYKMTFDVNNGQIGDAQLTIIFDETLTEEDVVIDLSDELFSSPAPSIKADGFTSGSQLELLAASEPANPLKFTIIARGGLSEANLTIASSSWTPAFGKEINLIAATPEQQQQIAAAGINVKGLYKNPDKMALVDITGLISRLPAGDYEISMQAKDRFTRVSDPVSLKLTSVPLQLTVEPQLGIFGVAKGVFNVSYNGNNPAKELTFKALNQYGAYVDCPVESVQDATRSRSIETRNYIVTITLPDAEREAIPVQVYLMGNKAADVTVHITEPEYSLAADAFSHTAILQVTAAEQQMRSPVTAAARVYVDGAGVDESRLTRDLEKGLIYIKGLQPATAYRIQTALGTSMNKAKTVSVSTEAATAIPNGDFSKTHEAVNISSIKAGGQYRYLRTDMQNYSSILVNEPDGWTTINSETCSQSANPMNTWFCVPSTLTGDREVTLRSVAYDHNGTLPEKDNHGISVREKYSRNKPASFASYAAGQLNLGNNGIDFASRPASLSFQYRYTPVNGESGYAVISVLDASGNVLATGEKLLSAASSNAEAIIKLSGYRFGQKAARLRVSFKSSTLANPAAPIPADIADVTDKYSVNDHTIAANSYKSLCVGSVLVISNVKLNY